MSELTPWEQFKKDQEAYAESLNVEVKKVHIWDFLDPNTEYAASGEADRRLDICRECPFLIKATLQCRKCGCFMKLKTKLANATCPEHKW